MDFASFADSGYFFHDKDDYLYFSSDNRHYDLFAYITKDLSALPGLFKGLVSKITDADLNLRLGYIFNEDDVAEIKTILDKVHPFYEKKFRDVLVKAIADHFNAMLYRLPWKYNEKLYTKKFIALVFALWPDDKTLARNTNPNYAKQYYDEYDTEYKNYFVDERFADGFVFEPPPVDGFDLGLRTQEKIHTMLYWILDLNAPTVELSIPQRAWLYGKMFQKQFGRYGTKVTKELSLVEEALKEAVRDYGLYSDIYGVFSPLKAFRNYHNKQEGVSPNDLDAMERAVSVMKKIKTEVIYEKYEINCLEQLLFLEVLSMMQTGSAIKECKNCGYYFVVTNRNMDYCDRIAEGEDKPCNTIGPLHTYKQKLQADACLQTHNRFYRVYYMRYKRGKISESDFTNWATEAKENLEKTRSGIIGFHEFNKWLKKGPVV